MITRLLGEGARMRSPAQELRDLDNLVADLRRLVAGELPSDAELRAAPFLEDWSIVLEPVPCLVGKVSGHPSVRGPLVRTSPVWAMGTHQAWARTASRYYALGRAAPAEASSVPATGYRGRN